MLPGLLGRMCRDQLVGGLDVAVVDQLARQHAPVRPPFVGIDQCILVARRLEHDISRLSELLGAPQIFGFGEEIAGRALRRRHRIEQLAGVLVVAQHRGPGVGERLGAGQFGHALCRFRAFRVEHALHAEAMVGDRKNRAELLDDGRFVGRFELLGAPERRQHGARRVGLVQRQMRAGKHLHALDRLRLAIGEGRDHRLRIRLLAIESALAVVAQRLGARPLRENLRRLGDLGARYGRVAAHGDRPGQYVPVERIILERLALAARLVDVAGRQRIEPGLERGDVVALVSGKNCRLGVRQRDRRRQRQRIHAAAHGDRRMRRHLGPGRAHALAQRQRRHQRNAEADDHQVMLLAPGHEPIVPCPDTLRTGAGGKSLRRYGEYAVNA